jgi:hypothetical protein
MNKETILKGYRPRRENGEIRMIKPSQTTFN